jgi:hypothetical protein
MDREIERRKKTAELLHAATALLESDLMKIEDELIRQDVYGSVLWKVMDAAGLLSPLCFPQAQGQEGYPTGRGFMLSVGEAWRKSMYDPKEL